MKNPNTTILESKLKRHKISYVSENGTIIIGKSKTDYTIVLGLIIFPLIAALCITAFLIWDNFDFFGANRGKIIVGIIFLFGTAFFNFSRIQSKKDSNNNLKTLLPKVIKIKNEFGDYNFDSNNIKAFSYNAKEINEDLYEGTLYLVDTNNQEHQILGFDDDNEKYVLNDLKWFSEYLTKHTEM
ncbi:hypothetical protein HNV10_05735 [Winogradskyella litoriviva]|uniref:YcxB-like protein n=1 Tax=Winogradskyella litoriviva TaxID=1220182 RepID=A0ABX2E433_9FLAO|nr:hypothetical protein [Winogradskyella litoriviva]NRD22731.1 hypothetical protein [Winogradskyella litoriviva]